MRILLVALTLLVGCRLMAANREYTRLEATLSRIGGTVHGIEEKTEPVLVVAFQETKEGLSAVNYEVLLDAGLYTLLLTEGHFRVFAFEDLNQDFVLQPGEPIGELEGGLDLTPGSNLSGLDIQLKPYDGSVHHPQIDLSDSAENPKLGGFRAVVGSVVSLDDPRFSKKSGVHGMWRPISALNRHRVGVFFLEEYDPCRTPVLFIHGMQGSPQDLRTIMEALDRRRYQIWFFAYPSGLRLRFLSRYLAESIRELGVRHKPSRLFVVAHSMGGLIGRSFINQNAAEKKKQLVRAFVTLSTPFNGHDGARVGVRFSPVVAPAWIDLVPNSHFIQSIYRQPLPDYVEHHLLFGYGGTGGASSDGTVTLRSMLDPRAQAQAAAVYGFDADHLSVLEADGAVSRVLAGLDSLDARLGPICPEPSGQPNADDGR